MYSLHVHVDVCELGTLGCVGRVGYSHKIHVHVHVYTMYAHYICVSPLSDRKHLNYIYIVHVLVKEGQLGLDSSQSHLSGLHIPTLHQPAECAHTHTHTLYIIYYIYTCTYIHVYTYYIHYICIYMYMHVYVYGV